MASQSWCPSRTAAAGPSRTSPIDDQGLRTGDLTDRGLRAVLLVHPLSWHRQRPGPPGLVLGYAAHPPDQLREAARRIARVLGT
jgi:GntR family transcriptional regulator / MocR family aminotransferase